MAHAADTAPLPHLARPFGLRCEGWNEPLAIADRHPRLSWRVAAASASLHGVSQSAYRIQVAGAEASFVSPHNVLWDSGIVASSATFGIPYLGPALQPGHAYEWRVEIWDEQKLRSGWSVAAHWTQEPAWHAEWIAAHGDGQQSANEPMPLFRKTFGLSHRVARALLYASGLGQDELRINGRKVGNDELTPGWSDYRKTVYYDTYDVTALLREGSNALGVMLGNGMYRVLKTPDRYTKFVGSFGEPKCTVQLEIDFANGSKMEVLSDGTWKTAPGPITFSHEYGGEDFDARLEPKGWDGPGFNDSTWQGVKVVPGPGGQLTPEAAPPIRVMHLYAPINVTHPKPGVAVYDLGQNFAGWPEISVTGPAGSAIKLIPGELLNRDGLVTQRSSGGPQWFAYTLRGTGIETWHPRFSYYGFRYVQVETSLPGHKNGSVKILSLRGQAVHTSSQVTGLFESSDDRLNRIHLLILRAIENNSMSLFTDCPHREKLGWLEEAHLLAPSMLYDFDFSGLYAATARNIADAQRIGGPKAGMVPEIAPQYVVFDPRWDMFNDSPEWGSASVLAPWYVFQRTGDRSFLAAQYDVMRRYVAYLGSRAQDDIITYGLGDWYDIGPGSPGLSKLTTAGLTATAIYDQDLTVMEKIAKLLGKNDESAEYGHLAEKVREAFNARFFDSNLHRYDKGSQTAQAMPLVTGLTPDKEADSVLRALVADIRAHQNHVTAGDIGYHYVVDALLDAGRSDVLLDMLERTDPPSYGYQLAQGATALTEAWDANPNSSQDHFMLGDAEEWFYRGPGGINLDLSQDGAKQLVLQPAVVGKIAWVRVRYDSTAGLIESSWRRGANETVYDCTIPANRPATIIIASHEMRTVTINGLPLAKASGVTAEHTDGNSIVLTVGSGKYEIRAANP